MANPIIEGWIYSTILIENHLRQKGTGFLVGRQKRSDMFRLFLATNKHVLHHDPAVRKAADHVLLHVHTAGEKGIMTAKTLEVALRMPDGTPRWREHPDPDTDVLVLEVSEAFAERKDLRHKWMDYADFPSPEDLERWQVQIGDEILMIGYPLGLTHRRTNVPLLRAGMIATCIGESLADRVTKPSGESRNRVLRGFLVDGGTIPGSSGSPVVLRPVAGRYLNGHPVMDTPPAMLLGILAEARYMPIRIGDEEIPSYSGLGLALDAATVQETIDSFFDPGASDSPPVRAEAGG